MFGKDKPEELEKKTDISAKMHTMSDDLAGFNEVRENRPPVVSTQKTVLKDDSPFSQKNSPLEEVKEEEKKEKKVPEMKAAVIEKPIAKEIIPPKKEKPKLFSSGPFLQKNSIEPNRESINPNRQLPETKPLRAELPEEAEPVRPQAPIRVQSPVKPQVPEKPIESVAEVKVAEPVAKKSNFFPKIESETTPPSAGGNFFPKIDPKPTEAPNPSNSSQQSQGIFRKDELTSLEGFDDLNEYESRSGFFVYLFMFLIILILGGGGYYVLVVKEGELPQDYSWSGIMNYIEEDIEKSKILIDKTVGEDTPPPKPVFSEKTNFLVVKTGELTKDGIKNLINNKFVKMKDYQGDQLEFLLVDEKNASIKFENFANAFGMVLDRKILDNANGNFSIFLSQKDGLNRMGLAINVKEKDLILKTLSESEPILSQNLKSILLDNESSINIEDIFGDSFYNGIKIRYSNLSSQNDLSIDYFMVGNYLIFATSKESGRLIIDRMLGE
ncbi:MAG: hypothetical protein V3574_00270 [Candidatus Moraniibacteriota bacterium]